MRPSLRDAVSGLLGVRNVYTHLLISLVGLLLILPLIEESSPLFPIYPILFLAVILSALRTLELPRRIFLGLVLISIVAYIASCLVHFGLFDQNLVWPYIFVDMCYATLIVFTAMGLNLAIFSEDKVTLDTIRGGIAIYLLFGIFFMLLYSALCSVNPNSFQPSLTRAAHPSTFLYYSFTTLTTLGYGDIVPKSGLARILSSIEALGGQLFLTIFVARLVGLHLAYKTGSRKDDKNI